MKSPLVTFKRYSTLAIGILLLTILFHQTGTIIDKKATLKHLKTQHSALALAIKNKHTPLLSKTDLLRQLAVYCTLQESQHPHTIQATYANQPKPIAALIHALCAYQEHPIHAQLSPSERSLSIYFQRDGQ